MRARERKRILKKLMSELNECFQNSLIERVNKKETLNDTIQKEKEYWYGLVDENVKDEDSKEVIKKIVDKIALYNLKKFC